MIKIYVPWRLPGVVRDGNPLAASLLDIDEPDIQFLQPVDVPEPRVAARTVEAYAEFTAKLMTHFRGHSVVMPEHVLEFAKSRNIQAQLLRPSHADLTFLHTTPDTIGSTPWIIHIETVLDLFRPHLREGQTAGVALKSQQIYWLVRYLLEQPECLAISTHLRGTEQRLGPLFESEAIAGKTHYIPMGHRLTPSQEGHVRVARGDRQSEDVVLLFTNSAEQRPDDFVIRGGVDVVTAFTIASKYAPNLRLILRSGLHEIIGADLEHFLKTHPRVTLVEGRISDEELFGLYCQADVFLLPSARLHCRSIARAMACGLVCVVSDAPGYEEFVSDKVTGFLLAGRREAVCDVEPETGWVRENYASMFNPDSLCATELATLMIKLAQRDTLRHQIGGNAQNWARQNMKYADWTSGFTRLVRQLPLLAWSMQAARKESVHRPDMPPLRAVAGR